MATCETDHWAKIPIPDYPGELDLVYIAGPMTGMPDWGYPAFRDMAAKLRDAGHRVLAPHELHAPSADVAWDWYLRRDLAQLVKCNKVVLLPGWGGSRGAQLEHTVAKTLGMDLFFPGSYGGLFHE